MKRANKQLGDVGEDAASDFLEKEQYKIIERNVRFAFGELDIIARAPDKTLVFIEIKTLTKQELQPEDEMTAAKIVKFRRAAEAYANTHEELIDLKKGYRLDLIAISKAGEDFSIAHYENVC